MKNEQQEQYTEVVKKKKKTFRELSTLNKFLVVGAILCFLTAIVFLILQIANVFFYALNVSMFALTLAFVLQAIRMKKFAPQSFSMYVFLAIMAGVSAILICIV